MKQPEFKMLALHGMIGGVVTRLTPTGWEVRAWLRDDASSEPGAPEAIETARGRIPRTWATLDSAYAWLVAMGWHGDVTISS